MYLRCVTVGLPTGSGTEADEEGGSQRSGRHGNQSGGHPQGHQGERQ